MYRLEANESCANGARRILLECIDETILLLTQPGEDVDTAVHEARKNFKRIRAVLRLVRSSMDEAMFQAENGRFRAAAHQLAPLRDSAVLVETLDALNLHFGIEAFATIRETLVARQLASRQQFWQNGQVVADVVDVLQQARLRLADLPLAHEDFAAFAGGLRRVYKRGRIRMALAYADANNAEKFHDWRKRVKYLWHHTEILQPMWPVVMDEVARELHQISDYLGDAHDLAELIHLLLREPELFSDDPEIPLLLERAAQRRTLLEETARPLGRRMYAEKPHLFVDRIRDYWRVWQESGVNGVPPVETLLLSTAEAAARLGVTVAKVRQMIGEGALTAVKIGSVWVVVSSNQ
jgi:excisionase family DNA binding protein